MRSLKIALVLAGVIALLSVGFAQGKGDTDKGMAKKPAMSGQSKMAKHHGKMMKKATGDEQADMAMHHGKMTRHHRHHHRHHMARKGHMMMKKGEKMENKGEKMEMKGAKMAKHHMMKKKKA